MSEKKKEAKVPFAMYELCDMKGSGFIKQGTEGTPYQEELRAPKLRRIPREGFRMIEVDMDGQLTKITEPIVFIPNQREISAERLKSRGITVNNRDAQGRIAFLDGILAVSREGKFVSLYDYMEQVFYNEEAKDRPEHIEPIFRKINKEKKHELMFEDSNAEMDAVSYVRKLVKKSADGYVYEEDKIDSICEMINLFADSYAEKANGILMFARAQPVDFLEKVTKWENQIQMDVTQAFKLDVLTYTQDGLVKYAKKEVVVKSFPDKPKKPEMLSRLADFFRSPEGNQSLTELRAEIEVAQSKD